MTERTLVLIKPDGVARGLVGEVLARIERKGFRLVALELRTLDRADGRGALRRARGQAVLRRPRGLHHLRSAGRRRWSRARMRSCSGGR